MANPFMTLLLLNPSSPHKFSFSFLLGCGARPYGELTEQEAHSAARAAEEVQKLSASCVVQVAKVG